MTFKCMIGMSRKITTILAGMLWYKDIKSCCKPERGKRYEDKQRHFSEPSKFVTFVMCQNIVFLQIISTEC